MEGCNLHSIGALRQEEQIQGGAQDVIQVSLANVQGLAHGDQQLRSTRRCSTTGLPAVAQAQLPQVPLGERSRRWQTQPWVAADHGDGLTTQTWVERSLAHIEEHLKTVRD